MLKGYICAHEMEKSPSLPVSTPPTKNRRIPKSSCTPIAKPSKNRPRNSSNLSCPASKSAATTISPSNPHPRGAPPSPSGVAPSVHVPTNIPTVDGVSSLNGNRPPRLRPTHLRRNPAPPRTSNSRSGHRCVVAHPHPTPPRHPLREVSRPHRTKGGPRTR